MAEEKNKGHQKPPQDAQPENRDEREDRQPARAARADEPSEARKLHAQVTQQLAQAMDTLNRLGVIISSQ